MPVAVRARGCVDTDRKCHILTSRYGAACFLERDQVPARTPACIAPADRTPKAAPGFLRFGRDYGFRRSAELRCCSIFKPRNVPEEGRRPHAPFAAQLEGRQFARVAEMKSGPLVTIDDAGDLGSTLSPVSFNQFRLVWNGNHGVFSISVEIVRENAC